MEINQLRIGNLVQIESEILTIVELNTTQIIAESDGGLIYYQDKIMAIPITDILIEEINNNFDNCELYLIKIDIANEYNFTTDKIETNYKIYFIVNGGLGDIMSYGYRIEVNFVHEIQNIYSALTGKEIKINIKN